MTPKIIIYGTEQCPWCDRAKELVESVSIPCTYHDIGNDLARREWIKSEGHKTVPQCYLQHEEWLEYIGGFESLAQRISK